MARKTMILTTITKTAEFLRSAEDPRPNSLELGVTSLTTFGSGNGTFSRQVLRTFAKTVLTARQAYGEGLKSLEGVNIKSLKDAQLGELLGMRTAKPNGTMVSKYYTTIRRMLNEVRLATKGGNAPAKPKAAASTKPKATRKPKATKKAVKKAVPKDTKVTVGGTSVTIPTVEFKANRQAWVDRASVVGYIPGGHESKATIIVKTIMFEQLTC